MKLKEIVVFLDHLAPFSLQESYDNSGIQIGKPDAEINAALLTIDVTEEVVEEAIRHKTNLIISHHPVIFQGIKSFTGKNMVERIVEKAIRNDISILSVHTNIDAISGGVNNKICDKLGLVNRKILKPLQGELFKLVFFVPVEQADIVRDSVFNAGAGVIGNYDQCSFNTAGQGSFRGGEETNPAVGKKGELHFESELRIETVFPKFRKSEVISALLNSHPYEEVAYDIYPIENKWEQAGMGMTGSLEEPMEEHEFLNGLKKIFNSGCIRYTNLLNKKIKKVAVCGGSGSFLIKSAISAGADVFVSGDIKYHQFFEAENKILIADIGHFESEQFTKELFYESLTKKFPKFALRLSEVITNPINYL